MTRYGHQPLTEIRQLSMRDLHRYRDALSRLVRRENDAGERD